MENQEHIEQLLIEFAEQRTEIKNMLAELEGIKQKVDTIFPEKLDGRFRMYFEEKVKAATSFFNVLLDMRKEITKSLKDEIEIRRKIELKGKDFDLEDLLDVRKMSDKVEEFRRHKKKLQKDRSKDSDEIPEDVEIPGVNAAVR